MDSINNWSLRFVRWGMGLASAGLLTGLIPLGHYLLDDAIPSCPSAPIHGHLILLSLVGMPMFGLLYRAIPAWTAGRELPMQLVRMHFWLSVIAIVGVLVNGTVVYELIGHHVQPGFYYSEAAGQALRNVWFGVDGAFLTMYGAGCGLFLYILMKQTSYSRAPEQTAVGGRMAG